MIRPANAGDAAAVTRLWTEAYVTGEPGGRAEPYAEEDYSASTARGLVFVAEIAGEVAGVVVLYPPGAPGVVVARDGEAELSRLAVAPSSRRAGIGTALLALCRERARAEGWRAIALWSRPWQDEAHRLYEAGGYRRAPDRDDVDAGGGRRVVFSLAFEEGGLSSPRSRLGTGGG